MSGPGVPPKYEPFGGGEKPKPQFPNEKLNLRAGVTTEFPRLSGARLVGEGGEAEVYQVGSQAVKIYKKYEPTGPFEDRIFALTTPAMTVATTARWADKIYHPKEILDSLNNAQYEVERLGLEVPEAYTLRNLQESFIDFRQLNPNGLTTELKAMFRERGLPVPQELQEGKRFVLPAEFKGGMATYINAVASHLSKTYPQLDLPPRIFPKIGSFGLISANDPADPEHRFAGRLALTMEFVPRTLEDTMIEGYERHMRDQRGKTADELGLIRALGDYLEKHCPMDKIKQVAPMLRILGGYGLVFADLKPGNIGIVNGGREVVLLDPGTAVRKGAVQDFATPDFLPDGTHNIEGVRRNPKQERQEGRLLAHPWFDQVALHKIMTQLITGGAQASLAGLINQIREEHTEEHYRETMTARALRNLKGRS